MRIRTLFRQITLGLMLIALPAVVTAEIYRWVDADGNVHFSDQPPPDNGKKAETVDVQDAPVPVQQSKPQTASQPPAKPLEQLIDRHRNINRALWVSASTGRLNDVKQLVRAGADIETRDSGRGSNHTPLLQALVRHNQDVAEYLIEQGADLSVTDAAGNNVLYAAALSGFDDLVLRLLAKGLDVNIRTKEGKTPLRGAIERNHAKAAMHLLRSKADPEIQDIYGYAPLMFAVMTSRPELVNLLLEAGANPNTRGDDGKTALLSAVQKGTIEIVRILLAAGADANARSNAGTSPLLLAARFGNVDIVAALLAAGADTAARDNDGETAASIATQRGHMKLLTRLERRL